MTEAEEMAARIQKALPSVKRGSLRFWGAWFGRPHDNIHELLACEASENVLKLGFKGEERLTVWFPQNLKLDQSTFQISDAERVLWEWYWYGRRKAPENLFFEDFTKKGETILENSNVDRHIPDLNMNSSMPAVEILRFRDPSK
ncbi:MAG TPA: hypothetical protein VHP80_06590 [Candidatus Acidoferrum sp.]|jgi:hypothetical protein|nr:hypothetical protein [Candidatus Acidoferrum sp.]